MGVKLANYYWAARFMLSGAICFYFVIVPAFIYGKMMRGKPGAFWRYSVGLSAMFFGTEAILAQTALCGYPPRNPHTMSLGAVAWITQLLLDLALMFVTYIYYYYKNKKLNDNQNTTQGT
jgi:hypothetical protein